MKSVKQIWKSVKSSHVIFIVLVGLAVYFGSQEEIIDYLGQFIQSNFVGTVFFIVVFALITVLVPLTSLPLIVPGSAIFGPLLVSIYATLGWLLGSMVAFIIARYLGKPFLSLFISIEKIEKYEQYLSGKIEFWGLVLLRMVMPVDLLSYAVGLLSKISFKKYMLATFLGITPFAFVFSYISDALTQDRYITFIIFSAGALLVFGVLYILYKIYRVGRKIQYKEDHFK